MIEVGFVGEDEGHFWVVTALMDEVLVERVDWLSGILESCRRWRGLRDHERWSKYQPDDVRDLRPVTIDGRTIKPQGRIAGKPLKPEASVWRKVLLRFCHANPVPDIVVLARDLDGDPGRRAAIDQVRNDLTWPFAVVAATPEPEIEAWLVSGFVPSDGTELGKLDLLCRELSFNPTMESHRLTSHPNTAPTDAKRVLLRLCDGNRDREQVCLERNVLHDRGERNHARRFLDEVAQKAVPKFSP